MLAAWALLGLTLTLTADLATGRLDRGSIGAACPSSR
jgi:hypothetical protein